MGSLLTPPFLSSPPVQFGSIPGAVNVPLGSVKSAFNLSDDEFKSRYGAGRMPGPDDPIVTFCMRGMRAVKAKDILRSAHGYDNVAVYEGSYTEWAEKHRKLK